MAAPTINGTVGDAVSPGFGNADVTLSKPSGTTIGEVLVAYITARAGTAIAEPAGWTAVYELQNSNVMGGCYTRIVDGSEGSSFTWSVTVSSGDRAVGIIFRVGGENSTTPVDVSGTSTQTGDSAADTSPSVTTSGTDRLILVCHHNAGQASTSTIPTGFTQLDDISNSGLAHTVAAWNTAAAAGATGTFQWAISGFAEDAVLSTVAIAPTGGSPPPPVLNDLAHQPGFQPILCM